MPESEVVPVELVTPPVPLRAALTVPPCRLNVEEEDRVPFEIVPLVSVTPPLTVCVVVPRLSVPPDTVSEFEFAPRVPDPEIVSVPLLTVVLPE